MLVKFEVHARRAIEVSVRHQCAAARELRHAWQSKPCEDSADIAIYNPRRHFAWESTAVHASEARTMPCTTAGYGPALSSPRPIHHTRKQNRRRPPSTSRPTAV